VDYGGIPLHELKKCTRRSVMRSMPVCGRLTASCDCHTSHSCSD